MADYYYGEAARKPKEKSLTMKIIDITMLCMSAASVVAIMLTIVTSYYDPSVSWIFPIVGLISPAIYVWTLLMMLYWVIRWRLIFAAILLLPLLVAAPGVTHYAKIETSKHYGDLPRRGTVRIVSFNTREYTDIDKQINTEEFVGMLETLRPEIICIQEHQAKRFDSSMYPKFMQQYNTLEIGSQALITRYKILEHSENIIGANFESGNGLWADLLIGSDTIRLFNIHLHSTAITSKDDEYLSNMEFIFDTQNENKVREIVSRFRTTSIGRAAQADSVATLIAQSPHRVIVCGDFNDTPNSYTFRTITRGLNDTFQEAGSGYPYTYRGFINLLRIDHILVDKSIEVLEYNVVDSLSVSDHLPVVTTLKI